MRIRIALLVIVLFVSACAGPSVFTSIGSNMSNPITLAVDNANARLYINNSNYRVSYGNGSIHIVDITDPTNPTREDYTIIPSFAGELYFDTATSFLYTPDRLSSGNTDNVDNLFQINVDESSGSFLDRTDKDTGGNPYGVACCDAENRLYVASQAGQLDYFDLDNALAQGSLSMTSTLSTGVTLSGETANRIVIIGTQAVVVRELGGLWVVNLAEVGVSGKYPIDYFIADITYPKGITTDGTYVYVTDVEYPATGEEDSLLVLDISSLTPRTDNRLTRIVDKDDDGLLEANILLDEIDPREVVVAGDAAFVTHFSTAKVSIVDLVTQTKTGEITVGAEPYGMAVYSPGGVNTHLFVANSAANTISVIDITTNTVVGTYP